MFGIGGAGGKGIIPAYAGNTKEYLGDDVYGRDHPRVCGEHFDTVAALLRYVGSSPRMRGTLVDGFGKFEIFGIIPAYAGNTAACDEIWSAIGDHPRVCGEHICSVSAVSVVRGSSPRMRGTRIGGQGGKVQAGIIPAYAGNTACLASILHS